jgi:hypothetical protein
MQVLSKEFLREHVSSIFSESAYGETSKDYQLYPTINVVDSFAKEGWLPVQASQQKVKNETRDGYQKHLIRFRHIDNVHNPKGELLPEIVLTNSHDGKAAYNLMAGVFRLVCSNGLVVPEGTVNKVRVVHKGTRPEDVIEASYSVIQDLPKAMNEIEEMRAIDLSYEEQQIFAMAAHNLKVKNQKEKEYDGKRTMRSIAADTTGLLYPRRWDDKGDDLFKVMNRVQENIIKGGAYIRDNGKRKRTREVKSINENIRLNTSIWILAQEMRKLKSA